MSNRKPPPPADDRLWEVEPVDFVLVKREATLRHAIQFQYSLANCGPSTLIIEGNHPCIK